MVTSEEAAFRILEISAILFPLLFLVIQLFSRHFVTEEDSPLVELGGFGRYIIYASMLLLVAVAGASTELINVGYPWPISLGIGALYILFILLGYTAAIIGGTLSEIAEREREQIDLTSSVEEVEAEEEAEPDEPQYTRQP